MECYERIKRFNGEIRKCEGRYNKKKEDKKSERSRKDNLDGLGW